MDLYFCIFLDWILNLSKVFAPQTKRKQQNKERKTDKHLREKIHILWYKGCIQDYGTL